MYYLCIIVYGLLCVAGMLFLYFKYWRKWKKED